MQMGLLMGTACGFAEEEGMLCLCMCGHCVQERETVGDGSVAVGDGDDMQVDNGTTFYLHYNHALALLRSDMQQIALFRSDMEQNFFVQIRYENSGFIFIQLRDVSLSRLCRDTFVVICTPGSPSFFVVFFFPATDR